MKTNLLVILALSLASTISFANPPMACPNFAGNWVCKNTEGEQWTEKISQSGHVYKVNHAAGTPDAEIYEVHADGLLKTESFSSDRVENEAKNIVMRNIVNQLPDIVQLQVARIQINSANVTSVKAQGMSQCRDGKIYSNAQFKGRISLGFAGKFDFTANVSAVDKLISPNRRSGAEISKGSFKASSMISALKMPPKPFQDGVSVICDRVK